MTQFRAVFGSVLGYLPSTGLFLVQFWVTDPVLGYFWSSFGFHLLENWRVMSHNRLNTLCNKLVISPKPAKTDKTCANNLKTA